MTTAIRLTLAGVFTVLLLGVVYASGDWADVIATIAGVATAVALLAFGVLGWERLVSTAQSAGLVERSQ